MVVVSCAAACWTTAVVAARMATREMKDERAMAGWREGDESKREGEK